MDTMTLEATSGMKTLDGTVLHSPHEAMERAVFHMNAMRPQHFVDEDTGARLDPEEVQAGIDRELKLMAQLGVGRAVPRPRDGRKVWGSRWCYRAKGDQVRCRFVVKQFRDGGIDHSYHAGTPGPEAVRVLITLGLRKGFDIATTDFSVAFMHTPMDKQAETLVEAPPQLELGAAFVWKLDKALYGLRVAAKAFQQYLCQILTSLGFAEAMVSPSVFFREKDGMMVTVHVDDPMIAGRRCDIDRLIALIGEKVTVKQIDYLNMKTPVRYLGMDYMLSEKGFTESIPQGYLDGIASLLGVASGKAPVTPGVKKVAVTANDESPLDDVRHGVFRSGVEGSSGSCA